MMALLLGDEPVSDRVNLKKELRTLRRDPLLSFLDVINDREGEVLHRESGRYLQAFDFYTLSAERCLRNISTGTRYHRQVKPFLGGEKRGRSAAVGPRSAAEPRLEPPTGPASKLASPLAAQPPLR